MTIKAPRPAIKRSRLTDGIVIEAAATNATIATIINISVTKPEQKSFRVAAV